MALQGTLETFTVPEVLRMLSSTGKSGALHIEGDRGRGTVSLRDGKVVSTVSNREQGPAEVVLFDLLRYASGTFDFTTDLDPHDGADPIDLEPLLAQAEALAAEWEDLCSVVTSPGLLVAPVSELDRPSVVVTAEQWRVLVTLTPAVDVHEVGRRLGSGELDAYRAVHDLVASGLVALTEPADGDRDGGHHPHVDDGPHLDGADPVGSADLDVPYGPPEPPHDADSDVEEAVADLGDPDGAADGVGQHDDAPDRNGRDEDLGPLLAHLSPRAAAAVEASSPRHGPVGPESPAPDAADPDAIAPVAAADGTLSRTSLMRFLSAARD